MRWCALLLLTACAEDVAPLPIESPLLRFPGFVLAIDVSDDDLRVGLTTSATADIGGCPRLLPSFVATIDGEPMSVEHGYITDVGLDSPEYKCVPPGVWTKSRGQYLRIADESVTFDIDLGDAMATRTIQLATTTLTRGDSFDLIWSSAADLANGKRVSVAMGLGTRWTALDAMIVDDRVRATLPTPAQLAAVGNGALLVTIDSARACPHLNCTIDVTHEAIQAITVQ